MAYGILRVRKVSAGEISSSEKHNSREFEKEEKIPGNIKPENNGKTCQTVTFKYHNGQLISKNFAYQKQANEGAAPTIWQMIQDRFRNLKVKTKSNSIHAIEYVIGVNDRKFYEHINAGDFFHNSLEDFFMKKFGKENILAMSIHDDESNPHAHVLITPIAKKSKKWKNRNGQGEKIEYSLSARDFVGGKEQMSQMQTDWFEYLSKEYGYLENRGFKFFRGILAKEQKRQYVQQTDHELGDLRHKLDDLKTDIDKKEVLTLIEEKRAEIDIKTQEFDRNIERHQKKNQHQGWKKGQDFDIGF